MDSTNEQPIRLAFPEASDLRLKIIMGPGRLRISPGAEGDWVSGTYRDPTGGIPVRVDSEGGDARITQSVSFPSLTRPRGVPTLELRLGMARSYALTIDGGANEITCDLGGVPLTRFETHLGAGQVRYRFSAPNPHGMDRLQLTAGAADVTVAELANANAAEVAIEGGAAAFHLNFGGALSRDCNARINVGMVSVDITVPATTAAKIAANTVLGGVEAGDGFSTREGAYWTDAAVAGQTPVLRIDANVTLSGLKIRTA